MDNTNRSLASDIGQGWSRSNKGGSCAANLLKLAVSLDGEHRSRWEARKGVESRENHIESDLDSSNAPVAAFLLKQRKECGSVQTFISQQKMTPIPKMPKRCVFVGRSPTVTMASSVVKPLCYQVMVSPSPVGMLEPEGHRMRMR